MFYQLAHACPTHFALFADLESNSVTTIAPLKRHHLIHDPLGLTLLLKLGFCHDSAGRRRGLGPHFPSGLRIFLSTVGERSFRFQKPGDHHVHPGPTWSTRTNLPHGEASFTITCMTSARSLRSLLIINLVPPHGFS